MLCDFDLLNISTAFQRELFGCRVHIVLLFLISVLTDSCAVSSFDLEDIVIYLYTGMAGPWAFQS